MTSQMAELTNRTSKGKRQEASMSVTLIAGLCDTEISLIIQQLELLEWTRSRFGRRRVGFFHSHEQVGTGGWRILPFTLDKLHRVFNSQPDDAFPLIHPPSVIERLGFSGAQF